MVVWDVLVRRDDLRDVKLRHAPDQISLDDGEVRLEVERFALTANNITYGMMGDSFGYWKFFPAQGGMGQIPVWGFARVVESKAPDAPVGLRVFGYLPMSTHFKMQPVQGRSGLVDASPHRADLPPTYNAYSAAPEDDLDDHRALLRPLLMTSWLLDDFLGEDPQLGAVVLSSASSKTAIGLAWFLLQRGWEVIGLTSAANAEALKAIDVYDRILTYDQAADLDVSTPAAFVDFAGDRLVARDVHTALGDKLVRSVIVGATHWDADRAPVDLPGVQPALFFAPDQIRKRAAEWGVAELEARFLAALRAFVDDAPWLKLQQHVGPDALLATYRDILEGRARPDEGHIIRPA